MSIQEMEDLKQQYLDEMLKQAANLSTYTTEPSRCFNSFYDDDDYEESTIPLNEIVSQIPLYIAITPVLLTLEPEDSFIMGNKELSTIPEKESDEVINSSVEDLVPIPSESDDTFESDSDCDLLSCADLYPINVSEEKSITFSNPLFDSNDDFTSSEDIENKDPYDSNLDEPTLLVTPLFDFNKDECFDPSGDVDEIELLFHRDPSTPKISVASILKGFTNEPSLEENDDLFNLESKENEWKKILYNAPIDDLMTEDKVFDSGIHEKKFLQHMIAWIMKTLVLVVTDISNMDKNKPKKDKIEHEIRRARWNVVMNQKAWVDGILGGLKGLEAFIPPLEIEGKFT
ncbi:hypothetical protein Tco_1076040 [Tanacetum coccineum]